MGKNQIARQEKILDDFMAASYKKSLFNFSNLQNKLSFLKLKNERWQKHFNGLLFSLFLYLVAAITFMLPITSLGTIIFFILFGFPFILSFWYPFVLPIGYLYPIIYFAIFKLSRISIFFFFLLNIILSLLMITVIGLFLSTSIGAL